ncbi:MAG: hypothetical protein HQM01_08995, partial [Magnetococcales bacterium]|nr:hypothetical protein [Magnetococcales bacterium]
AGFYYPTPIMAPSLVQWLDNAIKEGQVKRASAHIKGHLANMPAGPNDPPEDRFHIEADVTGATLHYFPPLVKFPSRVASQRSLGLLQGDGDRQPTPGQSQGGDAQQNPLGGQNGRSAHRVVDLHPLADHGQGQSGGQIETCQTNGKAALLGEKGRQGFDMRGEIRGMEGDKGHRPTQKERQGHHGRQTPEQQSGDPLQTARQPGWRWLSRPWGGKLLGGGFAGGHARSFKNTDEWNKT